MNTQIEINSAYWRGFRLAMASSIIGIVIGGLLSGCSGELPTEPGAPIVQIQCNENTCTIFVWDADVITTWHDGEVYWRDDIIPPGRRYTNRDAAPEVSLTVEACNEVGCTERTLVIGVDFS